MFRIFIDSSDIGHIDLYVIRYEIEYPRKVGIPGSEIIYGDLES